MCKFKCKCERFKYCYKWAAIYGPFDAYFDEDVPFVGVHYIILALQFVWK